jgi:ribosomal protein S18 acetylase RimI-like enzyme
MASLDNEIVGTAMAVRTGDLAGIYSVGTLEHARGRGVGRAVTAAAIEAAAKGWGVKRIFLQSSQMGLSVYESLGFHTVASYQMLGGMRKAR